MFRNLIQMQDGLQMLRSHRTLGVGSKDLRKCMFWKKRIGWEANRMSREQFKRGVCKFMPLCMIKRSIRVSGLLRNRTRSYEVGLRQVCINIMMYNLCRKHICSILHEVLEWSIKLCLPNPRERPQYFISELSSFWLVSGLASAASQAIGCEQFWTFSLTISWAGLKLRKIQLPAVSNRARIFIKIPCL